MTERKTRRKNWTGPLVLGGIALAGVGALTWSFMPQSVLVESAAVQSGSLVVEVVDDGRTRVIDDFVISSPLGGRLVRPTLHPGDEVTEGQVVARLVPAEAPLLDARSRAEAQATLAASVDARGQAAAAIEATTIDLERARRDAASAHALAQAGGATPRQLEELDAVVRLREQQLASARFAMQVATHQIEVARAVVGRMHGGEGESFDLTAPTAGRVLRVMQTSDGPVAPGTPILDIADPSALEVVVDVASADAVRIPVAAPVQIARWGGDSTLAAHVASVEPAAFTRVSALGVEEQRVNVVCQIDSPREVWSRLGDGYRVEARLTIDRHDDVLLVPEVAVFRRDDGFAAFRIKDGRASLVPITLGLRNGLEAEVLGGLAEGDRVVLHPGDAVTDGARVHE